jgi:beta-phosphoglucomutase-like phosphatase (HAD superfamily)
MISHIIFDLDGVLCDLVEVHRDAFNDALSKICNYKILGDEFWKYYNGLPSRTKLKMLINRGILQPEDQDKVWTLKQSRTFERIKKDLKLDHDKIKLHEYLKLNGYVLACVSNSILRTILLALTTTGQHNFMGLILGNESFGNNPKPHPYCYNLAIQELDVDKEKVLIVEDSEKGIMAARASGAHVWEVKNAKDVTLENTIKVLSKLNKRSQNESDQ